ncbi:MAG TPA: hypothetical protein VHD56_12155 [Tepidisphaeraceae bacterium]|nr:hypothetical protein [Tepidisphaeraceae bacterium]
MSPLTKASVILLVVLSLLLTAGTVAFVNQVHNYKLDADNASRQLSAEKARSDKAQSDAEAAKAVAEETVRQRTQQLEQAKQQMNAFQAQIDSKDAELAKFRSQLDIQTVSVTTLSGALKGSEDTKSKLQEQVNELRGNSDKLVTQNAQLNQTVTDLTNRLDVTERERKLLAEQLTEAKNQVSRQTSMLREAGVSTAQFASAGTRLGAPAINGTIKDVRPIRGVLYAAISVGSTADVTKGMEFKVINHETGAFLGLFTVDSVDLNEATGRLTGPRVNEIAKGADVKTQF